MPLTASLSVVPTWSGFVFEPGIAWVLVRHYGEVPGQGFSLRGSSRALLLCIAVEYIFGLGRVALLCPKCCHVAPSRFGTPGGWGPGLNDLLGAAGAASVLEPVLTGSP